eukprot:COSAG02_NODE_3039_length_7496_cov_89.964715_7_plen_313_part_00
MHLGWRVDLNCVGSLCACVRRSASGEELRQRLAEDGYVYLPQIFPREAVLAAQERMTEQMSDFLLPGGGERTLSPDAKVRVPWQTGWLQEQPEVMRVVEGEELFDMFARLFDEPASTFDYKWFRAVGPGGSSAFHFDGIYMKCALSSSLSIVCITPSFPAPDPCGKPLLCCRLCSRAGAPEQEFEGTEIGERQHTVWVPWSDVPIGESGIVVVEGSHRLPGFAGLRDTLGKVDVNYTEITGGFQFSDPAEVLAYDPAARLVTEDFRGPRSLFRLCLSLARARASLYVCVLVCACVHALSCGHGVACFVELKF